MGQVFLGFSPAGRPVAVKVVHAELATQRRFGADAVKTRSSRSAGLSWPAGPGTVVRGLFFLARRPSRPISRISRSTVHRDDLDPVTIQLAPHLLSTIKPPPLLSLARVIAIFSSSSRSSRADGYSSLFFAA